ncbi:MAG: amidase, partial [Gammaproteobacteria bacterium]|nr:amidase [Gammaproteobacteria bacterium]
VVSFKELIAPADSPVVRNLKNAGAIVVGRTNTPEFSFRATTDNELYGRTFNPWNDWASAGGSSGGAGAAAMMGYGPIHHGNDIGGSLRFPAACTGAVTVKPGFGRVPAYNPSAPAERGMLAQIMSVQGVIAREIRDVRLAMPALINYDPRDPWMVEAPFEGAPAEDPLKIAWTTNDYGMGIDSKVVAAVETARDILEAAGYQLDEVKPPPFDEIGAAFCRALFGEAKMLMDADVRKYGSTTIQRIFDDYYEVFGTDSPEEYPHSLAQRNDYVRRWTLFLAEYPLVLTPFLMGKTYAWHRDAQGPEGVREVMGKSIYGYSMNYMGLPAAIAQVDLNDGLPIGVQIIGRRFREDQCLDAAEAIEKVVGIMAEELWRRQLEQEASV